VTVPSRAASSGRKLVVEKLVENTEKAMGVAAPEVYRGLVRVPVGRRAWERPEEVESGARLEAAGVEWPKVRESRAAGAPHRSRKGSVEAGSKGPARVVSSLLFRIQQANLGLRQLVQEPL
jgi:hypothetical protein